MQFTLPQPDDWHLHVRDGEILNAVIDHTAAQFGRAIIMPNLKPPVTTVRAAEQYRSRILAALQASSRHLAFNPLMTLYLTDNTAPDEVIVAAAHPHIYAVKYYPAGATTNSDNGVTDLEKVYPVLEAMEEAGVPLLLHGEVTHDAVDIFDREAVFIEQHLQKLRHRFPQLRMVLEHVTTADGIAFVREQPAHIGATITAHHLLFNRNDLLVGGIKPHYYCLPILKAERHREALVEAAISGNTHFFAGTDSAPHLQSDKESSCGCAGCYTAATAVELYAEAFDRAADLTSEATQSVFRQFMSENGPAFYGLPVNEMTVTVEQGSIQVPQQVSTPAGVIRPLLADERLKWRIAPAS